MQIDRIQWYPGHMTKTRRMMEAVIGQVDAICEILDARIPQSSRNPALAAMSPDKPRLIVLNRRDQADPEKTALWNAYFRARGYHVLETDAKSGAGARGFENAVRRLLAQKLSRWADKGMGGRAPRVMIAGVPNVGKSSLINRITGRKPTKTENRPGVTREKQWVSAEGVLLMDTPGMLWPKFEDVRVGQRLAFTGAIRDGILDLEELACLLLETLPVCAPGALQARYGIEETGAGHELLERAARRRGVLSAGGVPDTERMAGILFDEFRGGKLGRITLEVPDEAPAPVQTPAKTEDEGDDGHGG